MANEHLRAYECNVRGTNWQTIVYHTSPGKAKSEYWRDVRESWEDTPFTAITCRVAGPPSTSDDFRRTAERRGVPFARVGMSVRVDGHDGVLVGVNSSANFDVLFSNGPWAGEKMNCHPAGIDFLQPAPKRAKGE